MHAMNMPRFLATLGNVVRMPRMVHTVPMQRRLCEQPCNLILHELCEMLPVASRRNNLYASSGLHSGRTERCALRLCRAHQQLIKMQPLVQRHNCWEKRLKRMCSWVFKLAQHALKRRTETVRFHCGERQYLTGGRWPKLLYMSLLQQRLPGIFIFLVHHSFFRWLVIQEY